MKKTVLFMLVITLLVTGNWVPATAQVVIGSTTQEPNAGALLDLSKSGDGLNTSLGLLLPSIPLTAPDMPLVEGEDNAEGMLIYCPGPAADAEEGDTTLAKGLYVWDGTQWKGVILS
ncbi:MAG: hypothetical protein LBN93_10550 [Candidatus Symbiothrix sp.]|jgi:hypothetical protein|nr:hypothetical protein [Candidatus Symbiothrix sp.]